jgi:hypothetical protein
MTIKWGCTVKKIITFLVFFATTVCYAGSASYVFVAQKSYVPVAVKLSLAAEYVVVSVSITSNEKDALRNIENVQEAISKLSAASEKTQNIKLRQGVVSLAVNQGNQGSFSSYGSSTQTSNTSLLLVSPLTKDRDVYQATREMATLVQTIQKNDQVRISFGTTSLGIEAPEKYREQLLQQIQKDLERVRITLGNSKSFEVSGLESAVAVVQQDDRNVNVFIPYRLKVGQ